MTGCKRPAYVECTPTVGVALIVIFWEMHSTKNCVDTTTRAGFCSPQLVSLIRKHHSFQNDLASFMFADKGKCTYRHEDEAFMLDNAATEIQDTLITCAGKEVWDNVTKE